MYGEADAVDDKTLSHDHDKLDSSPLRDLEIFATFTKIYMYSSYAR